MVRVRFGYPRLTVLLKRESWPVGKKLVLSPPRSQAGSRPAFEQNPNSSRRAKRDLRTIVGIDYSLTAYV